MLKNIENKTDSQLDLIRDQGDRQLDKTGRIHLANREAIEFYDGPDKELRDLVLRVRKETNDNAKKDKISSVTITGKDFNFNSYTNLSNFGSNIFTEKILLDKAINEQKELLEMINLLEKKIMPCKSGRPLERDKQVKVEKLI